MTNEEFEKEYNSIFEKAMSMSDKSRREGLIALEECIDESKLYQRDIMEVGLRMVCDGVAAETLNEILSDIISLEEDKEKKILKTIQKDAVMYVQAGCNPGILAIKLNSHVNIGIEKAIKILIG
jgi:flagellar motor component MotA